MNNLSEDQIAALSAFGLIGILIVFVVVFVFYVVGAWLMNVSLGIVGGRKPGILGCMGWLFSIGMVNAGISFGLALSMGKMGNLVAVPIGLLVASMLYARAGDINIFRGFAAYLVNTFLTVGAVVIIAFVIVIPLGMMGAMSKQSEMGELFQSIAAQQDAVKAQLGDDSAISEKVSPLGPSNSESILPQKVSLPKDNSTNDRSSSHRKKRNPVTAQTKRGKDGSQVNPFFSE